MEAPSPLAKPIVVGIYGIAGSGKTTMINKLKECLPERHFTFYDGSSVLKSLVPGNDMNAFKRLDEDAKNVFREQAIRQVHFQCAESGKTGIVAGHFSLWNPKEEASPNCVFTQADQKVYTHILYLKVEGDKVVQRVANDETRDDRQKLDVAQSNSWQKYEITEIRKQCRNSHILFSVLDEHDCQGQTLRSRVQAFVEDFRTHTEGQNIEIALQKLDTIVNAYTEKPKAMLVIDGDKTLIAEDSGKLFFDTEIVGTGQHPLSDLFGSPLKYSYTAFRQAALLHDEYANLKDFDARCSAVADKVTIHSQFLGLLQKIKEQKAVSVGAIVVTCGLAAVFREVLGQVQLSDFVQVIGGGRIHDQCVVTANVKAALVDRLQGEHGMYVWAFGDSVLDLPMLQAANEAIIAVIDEKTRSTSMEVQPGNVIDMGGFHPRQVLMPAHVTPRLSAVQLPIVKLEDLSVFDAPREKFKLIDATQRTAAKLLMTPLRDAAFSGSALREAHRQVGKYLAVEFVSKEIGLEKYPMKHVQGSPIDGYRLKNESKTLVVALMRGGEPMAFGVNEAFPQAMFLHAKEPEHIQQQHMQDCSNVILVDSVVNNGKTVIEFVARIRSFRTAARIIIVTGVAQLDAVKANGTLDQSGIFGGVILVALRVSENKYTGKGKTDTGARLFNTTQLE